MTICFATNNAHKLDEVRHATHGQGLQILSLADIHSLDELPETRDTLEGNALQKAEYVFTKFKVPCFADDTGLEVPELGGAPGVYSARYAGPQRSSDDNMALLLAKLGGSIDRAAQFRTVIALVGMPGSTMLFEGIVTGHITKDKRGTEGFGYDPIFVPDGDEKTFAEMGLDQKNTISHRARAVEKLVSYLKGLKNPRRR